MFSRYLKTIRSLTAVLAISSPVLGAELFVGAASTEITPEKPAALSGQFHLRISTGIETPITANVVVVESREGDRSLDLAIMVSCDVVGIPADVLTLVRQEVAKQLPDLDTAKIFLGATHTHTAPELRLGMWILPEEGVVQVEEYRDFFARKVADAIAKAWKDRTPGSVTWGLSHAVVAYNRRAVYADGSARMYGPTNGPTFRGLEGYEDHDVGTLFFWSQAGTLVAIAVICTNQFELFTDYGIRIKGRSKAEQTFVVQFVGPGTYLPTAKAVRGGHYSAIVHSSHVGPEGGQVLVDMTVELIDAMWAESK